MTFDKLLTLLRGVCSDIYDTAAPAGLTRFGVLTRYGASSIFGDGVNLMDLPRVQIDLYFQDPDDTFPEDVVETLRAWSWSVTWVDRVYDDDLARFRAILQTEVLD